MITELTTGTIDLIKDGLPYLRKVEDLPSRKTLLDNLDQFAVNCPCVYVIYEGGRFAPPTSTARRQAGDPAVLVAVVAKSLRDSAGRAASNSPDGAYQILDDLRATLLGLTPAPGFGQLVLASEGLAAIKSGIVCYISAWKAAVTIKPTP